ncbi:PREDICTED: uncharacterized protein LOC104709611 [Camelina sativa]|uniref:Uncharacterized protein LOC104709611 n=1 Tax=Camelina sativa TaxID=90675 RepID=A0ABM0TD16_CAMSA|nr:PREDICTED: uncharacterized protein LOC104709611 [Camelina sativa]
MAPATEAEVGKALFMMSPNKAPGPDGMTALFFQKAWRVVKEDLVAMVDRFLKEGVFDKSLNRTHICLIPKRLKPILPDLISETQTTFVPGRLISDNILIAQEMFHGLTTNPSCKGKFMAIKTDMSKYEAVSGQQINFAKSSIQFGHKVDEAVRTVMHGVLGISNLGGMGSYLGLPESLGGSKTKVFSFVRDKLQSRTTGWSAKLFSKGGKEVMIKSVAPAVPNFVMSCFRLPKTITSKLTSAVANFWWSTTGQAGGMHWLAWDKLCCSKQLGGLGFRHVDDFNSALLAKQLWRLIEAPNTLFARVFKGRYYRNSNPMEPIRSYSPSYGWRSIIFARYLVNKGLIIRVGSGESISIWTDPWVPAQSPRRAFSKGPLKDSSLQISHLIDCHMNTWRMDMLKEHFAPEDVDLIGAIPLESCRPQDSLGWHFTKSGKYTVKSRYDTELFAASRLSTVSRSGLEITPLLAGVWGAHCPPKIKRFMWQVLTGCILVSANLRRRGIACDSGCVRCGAEEETINHAIFCCPPARQVWALAQVPVGPDSLPTESVYANVDHFLDSTNPGSQIKNFPWLMWYIWKARNARVFEDVMDNPLDVVRLAEGEANAWLQAQVEVEDEDRPNPSLVPNSRQRESTSSLPNFFTGYRCFVDGSWKATDALAGAGWVCSSSQDSRSTMGATNFRRSLSPLHAEIEAFIWAMRCMIGHDYTDCSDLVKMVSSPHDWPAFTPYLDDIKIDQAEFSSFSLSLVPRNANVSADSLARQARLSSQHVLFVNNLPPNWLF